MKQADPRSVQPRIFRTSTIRTLDILLSMIGLILSAPLVPLIAALVKLDSRGPVFVAVERIGKNMKRFRMYKFRTMLDASVRIDQSVCPKCDPRVTTVGRILRRTKLNELPQLFNVLKGDMSFVGPRPEAPDLAETYPEEAKIVFSVKPGLVGPAVISHLKGDVSGRNEEELYPPDADPKQYYLEQILPEKIKFDLYFLSRQTISRYFKIILLALKETVFGILGGRHLGHGKRRVHLFAIDFALSQISFALATIFYFRMASTSPSFKNFLAGFLLIAAARPILNYGMGLYSPMIELMTPRDLLRVTQAIGLGSLLMQGVSAAQKIPMYPPLTAIVDFLLLSGLLIGVRIFLMVHFHVFESLRVRDHRSAILIFGANRNGLRAFYALAGSKNSTYKVVGFVDDDENKFGKEICGIKILGNRHHLRALSILYQVTEMVLVPDGESSEQISEIVALCGRAGIRSQIFISGEDADTFGHVPYILRPVQISDLLPRVAVHLDEPALRALLSDRTVLMLGSGGELGAALCRKIYDGGCRKLIIIDRYEPLLCNFLRELRRDLPGFQVIPSVLDGRDIEALNGLFVEHRPHMVIHAGMRKFIPIKIIDEEEVARSNYFYTFNLAKISSLYGCEYFVVISSIKAASQGNFVSESLRVAEISLELFFRKTPTRLIVIRVGNIIENRGGIVSWLTDQILEQKPLRLPKESAKTFLLSKNAAVRTILQSIVMGSKVSYGGLLHTAEPGACMSLSDIVGRIAQLYGLSLNEDLSLLRSEIPDCLIDDESATMSGEGRKVAISDESELKAQSNFLLIENMISREACHLTEHDWQQWTQDMVSMYGSLFLSRGKDLLAN